ncbi:MAG TPA: FAD-binding oxidoreductase [Candidatus Sulfotelmatobacter sp.]|nr:FAD-binding oxidoreductase [Candidatus Sulfotelmatobacter sp.]
MSTTASLAARLQGTIGRHRVVSSEEELAEYVVDGIVPGAIVKPQSAEEAAEVMRFAAADKLALIPVGSRSKCDIGMPPERYDIALDMTGMREIAHYDAGDLTLSVDAGTPLRQLEQVLAESQQFLPLAVPCFESSTVGGAIASGIDSVLRQQYGTARDFLIGAEFVDGKGNICKSGGRVVKNVTGYDLHKLLIGSLGTIGVITRLNFRTFPLAAAYGGHVASFESAERALAFRNAVEASGLPVANLELLSPRMAAITKAILEKEDGPVPGCVEGSSWAVYASFEGNERVVERVAQDVERLARDAGARQDEPLDAGSDAQLGGVLREAFEWLRWAAPAVTLFRITMPRILPQSLAALSRPQDSLRRALLVRAGGVVYFSVMGDTEDEETIAALETMAKDIFALAAEKQGQATLLHAPLGLKKRLSVWGLARGDFSLMKKVKQAFDPDGIFAPRRYVGGL